MAQGPNPGNVAPTTSGLGPPLTGSDPMGQGVPYNGPAWTTYDPMPGQPAPTQMGGGMFSPTGQFAPSGYTGYNPLAQSPAATGIQGQALLGGGDPTSGYPAGTFAGAQGPALQALVNPANWAAAGWTAPAAVDPEAQHSNPGYTPYDITSNYSPQLLYQVQQAMNKLQSDAVNGVNPGTDRDTAMQDAAAQYAQDPSVATPPAGTPPAATPPQPMPPVAIDPGGYITTAPWSNDPGYNPSGQGIIMSPWSPASGYSPAQGAPPSFAPYSWGPTPYSQYQANYPPPDRSNLASILG